MPEGTTPAAIPTDTPTPAEPYYVGCADDGVSGVGAVRGNTNGNLAIGGRAVCDGTHIYYVEGWEGKRILCQDMTTGDTKVLLDWSERTDVYSLRNLNLLGDQLYFLLLPSQSGTPREICRMDVAAQQCAAVYSGHTGSSLLVVYGKLFLSCISDPEPTHTLVIDCHDYTDIRRIDGVAVLAAMDGLLYGRWDAEEPVATDDSDDGSDVAGLVAIDAYGNVVRRYLDEYPHLGYECVPVNGKVILFSNTADKNAGTKGHVWVYDEETGARTDFVLPVLCSTPVNATQEYLYIQSNLGDENGDIYRIRFDGMGWESFDRRLYTMGCSLYEDMPLEDYVPCDDADSESVTEAWEREMQAQRGGE